MSRAAAFLMAVAAAVLCAGCAGPMGGAPVVKGKVHAQTYSSKNLPRGQGSVEVAFVEGHGPEPVTRWALVGNYGPGAPKKVTTECGVDPLPMDADTYGLIFEVDPPPRGCPPKFVAPDPVMVSVLDEQRLTVWITYKGSEEKAGARPARRSSR